MKILLFVLMSFALSLFSSICAADTPVWKVSKDDNHLYIGGTVHLLSEQDYPLPRAFDTAFDNSQILVFETDIAALSLPENQSKLAAALSYQNDGALQSDLNKPTYKRLEAFLSKRKISMADVAQLTPGGLSLTLTVIELQRMGVTGAGVDEHFDKRARQASKETQFFESIDEQIGFIKAFSSLDANKAINSTLDDLESLQEDWQQLIKSWRTGDMAQLEAIAIEKMQKEYPSVYQFLVVERNQRWISKITTMLETKEIEFILVGALHLAGKQSVLSLLGEAGYTVQQLQNKPD